MKNYVPTEKNIDIDAKNVLVSIGLLKTQKM